MKLVIAAVGKFRAGSEQQLFSEYMKRLPWKAELKQLPQGKAPGAPKRMQEEGRLLIEATASCARRVLLDERGKTLSSRELASQLQAWQQGGEVPVAFLIGGPDGASDEVRKSAHLMLSFGRASWPHMLVRVMLAEQLYRAHTLLSGHPYHRE